MEYVELLKQIDELEQKIINSQTDVEANTYYEIRNKLLDELVKGF